MVDLPSSEIAWAPTPRDVENARITSFTRWLRGRGLDFETYDELWRWSVDDARQGSRRDNVTGCAKPC